MGRDEKEEEMSDKPIFRQGLKCLQCGNRIFSDYRHDFKVCKCGAIFVDGGYDYFRYGALKEGVKFQIIERKIGDEKV